jgi:hypothetical protein
LFRNVAEKELAELSLYNQLLSIPQLEVWSSYSKFFLYYIKALI